MIRELIVWLRGQLSSVLLWIFGEAPQREEKREAALDKEISERVAKEIARQVGNLSLREEIGIEPVKQRPKKTLKIKTGYVPEILDLETDGEDIQTNLGEIKAMEEQSGDVDSSLKALKEMGGKNQKKS